MRHKLFYRKLKSSLILLVASVVLVSTLFASAINTHDVYAADSVSASKSAKYKQIFGALATCLRLSDSAALAHSPSSTKLSISYGASNWGGFAVRSAYVESIVEGGNDDGITNCGKTLYDGRLGELLKVAGITKETFYCNYKTDVSSAKDTYGLLKPNSENSCKDQIQQGGDLWVKNSAEAIAYLEDLFTNSVYGGNVPGGSLYSLTDLESYYAKMNAFDIYCKSGSGHYGDEVSSSGYKLYNYNPSTKRVELVGYSIRNNRVNHNLGIINTYNNKHGGESSEESTCSKLAATLGNANSKEVKARLADQIANDKTDCNNSYDKQYKVVLDWVTANSNSLNTNQEADVSIFLANYSRQGKDKWKVGSDGVTVTCPGLDSLKVAWNDIVRKDGITNAPTVSGEVEHTADPNAEQDTANIDQNSNTCHGAAGALGWVLCPILEGASKAASWAYEKLIEPSLKTNPELFKAGDSSGTYDAWKIFRDFANIVFAIFLLFIIFSQVSGFGIDNYGIKKSLPKLIVAAVLVNTSFYICQGLIDISNIVGSSVYSLLNSISIAGAESGAMGNAGSVTVGLLEFVAFGTIGTVIGGVAFWTTIGSALLAVVPALISAAVAILFLFFLLALRQAVVVVLVAIAPLAFVCYALPNTKKLFDRWAQILRGMLLLYPIAALLMAGGRLASRIIFSSGAGQNNLGIILGAMAAEIAPLFFIPSVVRSAYNATGQLGASLSGLQRRWTAGAGQRARNNSAYQRATNRMATRRANQRFNTRRMKNYDAAVAAVENGTATNAQRRLVENKRLRDRYAAIKQAAAQAAQEEGTKEAWAKADAQSVTDGSRNKAMANAQQQLINTRDYADEDFTKATITQATAENARNVERQKLWNDESFAQAERNKAKLETRNAKETNKLYARNDYMESRIKQQDVAISNETTKMYADKYSRMGMSDVMDNLRNSVANEDTEDRIEQFTAAANALTQIGQADKVREIISSDAEMKVKKKDGNEITTTAAEEFGRLIKNDEYRNRVTQVLGSSGEFTFQEYAKHLGINREGSLSFAEWVKNDSDVKGMSLRASIKEKGIGYLDKDALKFIGSKDEEEVRNILASVPHDNISRVAASTTDAATISALAGVISKLDNATRKSIIESTSADRAASMDQSIRDELATVRDDETGATKVDDSLWRDQIGEAIRDNPQIAARFSQENREKYIAPPVPSPAQNVTVNINDGGAARPTTETVNIHRDERVPETRSTSTDTTTETINVHRDERASEPRPTSANPVAETTDTSRDGRPANTNPPADIDTNPESPTAELVDALRDASSAIRDSLRNNSATEAPEPPTAPEKPENPSGDSTN